MSTENHPGRKIKAFLKLKGLTQNDIARRLGIGKASVSLVICGMRRSKRTELHIASLIGVKASNLWLPAKRTNIKFVYGRRALINGPRPPQAKISRTTRIKRVKS